MHRWVLAFAVMGLVGAASAEEAVSLRVRNETAVGEVASGARTVASAAWWGFNAEDSTEALQAAINSGAGTVVVPYVGEPWIVRPIRLRSDLEVRFEPGVTVLAKAGEFRGKGDSLFAAADLHDVTLRGYGATLRMRKSDYQNPPYDKAEWRMGISLRGCERVTVEGLRIESSGGDGIYVGTGKLRHCKDVVIRNVTCLDHHRQGISVISAENLLIEGCVLSNTGGTAPEAGIDFEPNGPDERLINCVVRNCVLDNNKGHGILIYLKPLSAATPPVSIRFEDCLVRGGESAGIAVGAAKDDGPAGSILFLRCTVQETAKEAVRVFDKSVKAAAVRFEECAWRKPWRDMPDKPAVLVETRNGELVKEPGGIAFVNCDAYGLGERPAFAYSTKDEGVQLRNVGGTIAVHEGAEAPVVVKVAEMAVK